MPRTRLFWALSVVGILAPGCELLGRSDKPAPAPIELRNEHLVSLSRSHCAGCPDDWKEEPCEFLDVLKQEGSGSAASLCRNLDSQRTVRKFPPDVTDLAHARVNEAASGAARSPDEALRLFAFGNDLHRMGRADLWQFGDEVQDQALTLLSTARPDARWPGHLLRLVDGGVPPVRITDVLVGDAVAATRLMTPDQLVAVRRASELAREAIRTPDQQRLDMMRTFSAAYPWEIDPVDTWAAGEQLRTRATAMALSAAVAALSPKKCVDSLENLVPDRIARIPEGWTLEAATCTPRPPSEPPARVSKPTAAPAADPAVLNDGPTPAEAANPPERPAGSGGGGAEGNRTPDP